MSPDEKQHLCFKCTGCAKGAGILPLQVRSLGSQVRLDARTKLLNPKWYEGMLSSGYEGVREIQKRLTNTVGWSATSGAVDNWVYDEVCTLLPSCVRSNSVLSASCMMPFNGSIEESGGVQQGCYEAW